MLTNTLQCINIMWMEVCFYLFIFLNLVCIYNHEHILLIQLLQQFSGFPDVGTDIFSPLFKKKKKLLKLN